MPKDEEWLEDELLEIEETAGGELVMLEGGLRAPLDSIPASRTFSKSGELF